MGIIAGTVIQANGASKAFECESPDKQQNCVQKGVWPSYLILLAVPGAAAAAAKMSEDEEKKTVARLAATTLTAAKASAQDELNKAAAPGPGEKANEADKTALERSEQLLAVASRAADPGDPTSTTAAISDIQYFVFNVFAMLFVLSSLIPYGRLPEIPELLLALTGASALVYTVNRHTTT